MYLAVAILIAITGLAIIIFDNKARRKSNLSDIQSTVNGSKDIYKKIAESFGYETEEESGGFGYRRRTKTFNITTSTDDYILLFLNRSKKLYLHNKFRETKIKILIYILFFFPIILSALCVSLGVLQFIDIASNIKKLILLFTLINLGLFILIAIRLKSYEKKLNELFGSFIKDYLSDEQYNDNNTLIKTTEPYFFETYVSSFLWFFLLILEGL